MCRLLCVHAPSPFAIGPELAAFAGLCEASREYQGHGWGYSYWHAGAWRHYHDIRPIWEDPTARDAETTLLVAHARSAFRDEGIAVENNMPFHDDRHVFVFNGELQGVRIKADGRIGAEKIFNFVKRFDAGDLHAALERATGVIHKRTRYVRALNAVIAGPERIHVTSSFAEDPGYFQMHVAAGPDRLVVCSEPLPHAAGDTLAWQPFPNQHTQSFDRW